MRFNWIRFVFVFFSLSLVSCIGRLEKFALSFQSIDESNLFDIWTINDNIMKKCTLSYMEYNTKSISRHEETICVSTKRWEIPVGSSFCVLFCSLIRSPCSCLSRYSTNQFLMLNSVCTQPFRLTSNGWKLVWKAKFVFSFKKNQNWFQWPRWFGVFICSNPFTMTIE